MTKEECDAVLSYVAQNIISPLSNDTRSAREVWYRLSGEDFNKFCAFMRNMIE